MTHAIEILEERMCALRAHIRLCGELSDQVMANVGNYAELTQQLQDIKAALAQLRPTTGQNGETAASELQRLNEQLAARVAAQSELLTRRAEK